MVYRYAGDGQVIDPLGGGSWSGETNALKHTQSPLLNQDGGLIGGGLDDRFDFQFLSPSLLDGGGFDLIEGTYRSLGNDGDHYNQAINAGNNYYFPGDTQRGNSLADALIIASDHLPLIADYQVPAILGWDWNQEANRVLVGADTSVDFMIQNDAPVLFAEGADILQCGCYCNGRPFWEWFCFCCSIKSTRNYFIACQYDQMWEVGMHSVTLTSTSPETQTTPEKINIGGEVIAHANASFSNTQDIDWYTHEVSFVQGTGVQSFYIWMFNYQYDGTQSFLEVDNVSTPTPPIIYEGMSISSIGSIPSLITFNIDTDQHAPDIYSSQMPIEVSDEDLLGEQTGISMLTLHVEIIASEACEGDINGDGEVNVEDLLILIGAWGGDDPAADLDGNGTVGVSDLLLLIAAWGAC